MDPLELLLKKILEFGIWSRTYVRTCSKLYGKVKNFIEPPMWNMETIMASPFKKESKVAGLFPTLEKILECCFQGPISTPNLFCFVLFSNLQPGCLPSFSKIITYLMGTSISFLHTIGPTLAPCTFTSLHPHFHQYENQPSHLSIAVDPIVLYWLWLLLTFPTFFFF